jgi:hypothetical protein
MGAVAREQSARRRPRESQSAAPGGDVSFRVQSHGSKDLTFKRVLARLLGTLCVHPNGRRNAAIHSVEAAMIDFTFV